MSTKGGLHRQERGETSLESRDPPDRRRPDAGVRGARGGELDQADELRRSFEESSRSQNRDPDAPQVLGELLAADGEVDADRFWDEVSRNLAANRLRLLFVADGIPDPLERVVERFLNAHMPRHRGACGGGEAVPGREDADARSPRPRKDGFVPGHRLAVEADQGTVSRRLRCRSGGRSRGSRASASEALDAAVRLLDAADDAGARFEWGPSGVSVRAVCELWPQPVTVAWLYPPSKSGNGWMRPPDAGVHLRGSDT